MKFSRMKKINFFFFLNISEDLGIKEFSALEEITEINFALVRV